MVNIERQELNQESRDMRDNINSSNEISIIIWPYIDDTGKAHISVSKLED